MQTFAGRSGTKHECRGPERDKITYISAGAGQTLAGVKSSQVTFIYIALLTIQIVSTQLHNIKIGKS